MIGGVGRVVLLQPLLRGDLSPEAFLEAVAAMLPSSDLPCSFDSILYKNIILRSDVHKHSFPT